MAVAGGGEDHIVEMEDEDDFSDDEDQDNF